MVTVPIVDVIHEGLCDAVGGVAYDSNIFGTCSDLIGALLCKDMTMLVLIRLATSCGL